MIQGGDPAGTGSGADPVYKFKNEVSPDLLFDKPGRLAYANAGPDTNSSQFFITEVATPHLNGGYTIFGQCDDATVVLVKQIARMATDPSNDKPFRPVKIIHISIVHSTGDGSQTRGGNYGEEAGGGSAQGAGESELRTPTKRAGLRPGGQPKAAVSHMSRATPTTRIIDFRKEYL